MSDEPWLVFCAGFVVGCIAFTVSFYIVRWALHRADRRDQHVSPNNALVNCDLSGARKPPRQRRSTERR